MSPFRALRSWRGPPLAWQIIGLLVGGLVVAQLVTLLLTMVLPPEPSPKYNLSDIAAALRGEVPGSGTGSRLERRLQVGPPDLSGVGWLQSDRSRRELAGLLGTPERRVSLGFYTLLPFAGALAPDRQANAFPVSFPEPRAMLVPASYMFVSDPGGPSGGAGGPGNAFPASGLSGGMAGGMFPGGAPGDIAVGARGRSDRRGDWMRSGGHISRDAPTGRSTTGSDGVHDGVGARTDPAPAPAGVREGGRTSNPDAAPALREPGVGQGGDATDHAGLPPERPGGRAEAGPGPGAARGYLRGFPGVSAVLPGLDLPAEPPVVQHMPLPEVPLQPEVPPPLPTQPVAPTSAVSKNPASSRAQAGPTSAPALPHTESSAVSPRDIPRSAPVTVPLRAPARGLFGLAPAPFVEGDFVAAWQQPDGRWAVVQPAPEPFPNAWQRRLILWFAVAFAIVGPLGLLFARRLVKPLTGFATAAEQLGRDPSAAVLPLEGPAEIGRAANAFNVMQSRLRAFVDDRTAMVGAISHDLRTPLTRMRFRIEEVDDEDIRTGMTQEVAEMEAMISSVLDYIRDASTPGVREQLDLRLLVDDVVDDRLLVGNDVIVERTEPAPVEVDVLGMRRVLDNLLENAVKYGARARVRLHTDADEAVAEIIDDGPGLPEDELEKVFEPFYRGERARASDTKGSGLGLAVCRSIARAHGGDVRLVHSAEGFLAQVRVPLAYGADREAA